MLRTTSTVLLTSLAVVVAASDRPVVDTPDPTVLVARLASPEFREREAAAKALDALGEVALPALEKALATSDDAELIGRANDLVSRITRRVENAKLIAPTRVELDFTDVPLVDILAAIEQQSGYRFFLPKDSVEGGTRSKRVTICTEGPVPFWQALDALCEVAGLRVLGAGLPQPDPRYLANADQNRGIPGRPIGSAPRVAPGFVPAVPVAPPAAPPPDPEVEKKAAEKQAAKEKAAKDLAAAAEFWEQIQKKAEQAVQPKKDEKPAAPPAPAQQQPAQARQLQLQALQAEAEFRTAQTRMGIAPATVLTILLAPQSEGDRPPSDSATAVKIEALPPSDTHRVGQPADTLLVLLQATPEPKLGLEQLTDVRVLRAVANTGRELVANKVEPAATPGVPTTVVGGLAVQRQVIIVNGQMVQNTTPITATPPGLQTLLRLKAPDADVATLSELTGLLVGTVRTPATELVSVADLYPENGPQTHSGQQGTTLRAVVTDENVDETFTLDVTLAYNTSRVSPAVTNRDEAIIRDQLGQAIPVAVVPQMSPGRATVLNQGLVLTDAAGLPFLLTASAGRMTFAIHNGERVSVRTLRLTAAPIRPDQGKPAKLVFYGTWQKPIEVPFSLTNVPVAAGAVRR